MHGTIIFYLPNMNVPLETCHCSFTLMAHHTGCGVTRSHCCTCIHGKGAVARDRNVSTTLLGCKEYACKDILKDCGTISGMTTLRICGGSNTCPCNTLRPIRSRVYRRVTPDSLSLIIVLPWQCRNRCRMHMPCQNASLMPTLFCMALNLCGDLPEMAHLEAAVILGVVYVGKVDQVVAR